MAQDKPQEADKSASKVEDMTAEVKAVPAPRADLTKASKVEKVGINKVEDR